LIPRNKIWVFIPAYNEAIVIEEVIHRVKACGYSNIVLIDDGSIDDTFSRAIALGIYGINLSINRGVGAATQAAIHYAKSKNIEYLLLIDADGQHYPEDIDSLVMKINEGNADIVIGSRFLKKDRTIPRSRKIYNRLANMLTLLGRTRVTDSQSGFRLLNNNAIHQLELDLDKYGVCTEMIWRAYQSGLKIEEVPIRVHYSEYTLKKGQNFWTGIKTAFQLFKKL